MSEIERLVSSERLTSYMAATKGDLSAAIELYDWNQAISAAMFADLARLEVVVRNVIHQTLQDYVAAGGATTPWYTNATFFPGRAGQRSKQNIADAQYRATRNSRTETEGRVVAELMFGFWRFLCARQYLTTLWVPVLASAFPNHPTGNARQVRSDVEARMERLHFLRNRVAHHEPIHRRSLNNDRTAILELAEWISPDGCAWIGSRSNVDQAIKARP